MKLVFSLIILLLAVLLTIHVYRHFSRFIDGRPAEKLTAVLVSPDGLHTMEVYDNGGKGATVGVSSVVMITANDGGEKWKGKKTWCVYYTYHYSGITAEWISNDTVLIHNRYADEKSTELSICRDEYYVGR